MKGRLLVVEDDPALGRTLLLGLVAQGFEVLLATDGDRALQLAGSEHFDLIVLDLGLPKLSGTEVLRRLRRFADVPVIVLSARDRRADKVDALDLGADDYVTKPFDAQELLARIRASLRRAPGPAAPSATVTAGDVEIDLARRRVLRAGEPVRLSRTELALLEEFVTNPGKLLTREHLVERLWGGRRAPESSTLRVHVKGLRRKLGDDAANPSLIVNEIGIGYRWIAGQDGVKKL